MSKKLLAVLLLAAIGSSVVATGSGEDNDTSSSSSSSSTYDGSDTVKSDKGTSETAEQKTKRFDRLRSVGTVLVDGCKLATTFGGKCSGDRARGLQKEELNCKKSLFIPHRIVLGSTFVWASFKAGQKVHRSIKVRRAAKKALADKELVA